MKTRNGFISNSSSSSFILALGDEFYPSTERTPESIRKILFGDKETFTYYDNSFSTLEIAKVFLEDLKKAQSQDLFEIASELSQRYCFNESGVIHGIKVVDGVVSLEERRDFWYYGNEPYFGVNETYISELTELEKKSYKWNEDHWKELNELEESLIQASGIKVVPYPSTEEGHKGYDEYLEARKKILNGNSEWKKMRQERNPYRDKIENLTARSALEDAIAFWDDTKNMSKVVVEYEDHSRLGACMEHGGIFKNIPHVRISHH